MTVTYAAASRAFTFSDAALRVFSQHRQSGWFSKEAGGQLFGSIDNKSWVIDAASGPRKADVRGRFRFWPDRKAEQEEINSYFDRGMQYLGDWHTHPQDVPVPSSSDIESISNVVRQSQHDLPGFLMCIVGRLPPPTGIWVSYHPLVGDYYAAKPRDQ